MASAPAKRPVLVTIGNPNTGKSTLFNALTGLKQRVGNFPGVTVEHVVGTRQFTDCEGRTLEVEALHRPVDARPIVENRTNLLLDLRTLDS